MIEGGIVMMTNKRGTIAMNNNDLLYGKLDGLIAGLLKTRGVKQALAAVESGDGSFQWSRFGNSAEPDELKPGVDIPFWIASVTKLFIAASILKLGEKKILSIDNPVNEYLNQSLIEGLHCTKNGVDKSSQITLRHLLSHTSGLPDYIEIKPKDGKSLFEVVLEKRDHSWTVMDSMQIVKEAGSPLFDPQPLEKEVIKARYSDTNFQLLIAVIEKVTGKPITTVFKDMFYKPLNLRRTFHPGSTALDPATPEPMPVWIGDQLFDKPLAMKSFGDLYSTPADLFTFMRSLNSGLLFDNPDTTNLMREKWNRFGFLISPIAPGWPIEYGLGMMRFELPRFVSPFKAVPAVIGHTGASGAWLFYCPANDTYLAGTVSQVEAAAAPFRFIPKALKLFTNISD
jgi:D-alanyl-D-alanine carboxypeptidase